MGTKIDKRKGKENYGYFTRSNKQVQLFCQIVHGTDSVSSIDQFSF
jgi:hypothetical protein